MVLPRFLTVEVQTFKVCHIPVWLFMVTHGHSWSLKVGCKCSPGRGSVVLSDAPVHPGLARCGGRGIKRWQELTWHRGDRDRLGVFFCFWVVFFAGGGAAGAFPWPSGRHHGED